MTQIIDYATPQAVEPRRRGRGFLAVALSMLWPGLGHLAAGAGKRAAAWLAAWVGLTLLTLGMMSFEKTVPALLLLVPASVAFTLLLWIDAYRTAHRRQLRWPAAPALRYVLGIIVLGIFVYAHPVEIAAQYWKLPTVEALRVPGAAMQPTIASGDRILNHKLTASKRWDVTVYYRPSSPDRILFVSRLVGLPGDHLAMRDGVLHINGEPASPPAHVATPTLQMPGSGRHGVYDVMLGDDEYFVLGDNSAVAFDSRVFGPVKHEALRGRATWIYWPLSRMGRIE